MGLQSDMRFAVASPNLLQRTLQRMGATSLGTKMFSLVLGPLDSLSHKVSRGRITIGRSLGALPVVMLTTTGARTGEMRTTPINAIPVDDDLALIGTNYGKGSAPGWCHNLRAEPRAVVTHEKRRYRVVAREADSVAYEDAFAAAISIYPGYSVYRRKASNHIPVFILKSEGSE